MDQEKEAKKADFMHPIVLAKHHMEQPHAQHLIRDFFIPGE